MNAGSVHKALVSAGVPVDGVSVGKSGDKSTWQVGFSASVTDMQRALAQATLDSLDASEGGENAALTVEEKLARIGLTLDDLKAALGK